MTEEKISDKGMLWVEHINKLSKAIREGLGDRLTNSDTELRIFAIRYLDQAPPEAIQDLEAYIDFAHENNKSKEGISFNVMHDIGKLIDKRKPSVPKSKGYHALMEKKGGEKHNESRDQAERVTNP